MRAEVNLPEGGDTSVPQACACTIPPEVQAAVTPQKYAIALIFCAGCVSEVVSFRGII